MTLSTCLDLEHYRIKKFILRINPVDYVQFSTGNYVWLMDGRTYTHDHLSLIAQTAVGAEFKAMADRGLVCLNQVRSYMDWFNQGGFDDFMMTTKLPILTFMPDWLYWHEYKRLRTLSLSTSDPNLSDYYTEALAEMLSIRNAFKKTEYGWLVQRGEDFDYIITDDGRPARVIEGNLIV